MRSKSSAASSVKLWSARTVLSISLCLILLIPVGFGVSAQAQTDRYVVPLGNYHIAQWLFPPNYADSGIIFIMSHVQEKLELQGIHRSDDRGETWKNASSGLNPEDRYRYYVMAVSPRFEINRTLWLFGSKPRTQTSGPRLGMWESKDGGESWRRRGAAVPEVNSIVVSPTISEDGIMLASLTGYGVIISHDIGATWEFLVKIRDVSAVYAPPTFPAEPFIAVATTGSKVKISTDGGRTFETSANGLPESMISIRGIAFSQNFAKDRKMFCFGSGGIFVSNDAGANWTALVTPAAGQDFTAMAVTGDFNNYGAIAYGTDDGEIYLSDDMGKTFSSIGAESLVNHPIETLAFPPDYQDSRDLFFSSRDGIFRYGPDRTGSIAATAEAAVKAAEATRSARATSAAGYHFVPKDPERVETGCIAYTLAPVGILVSLFQIKRRRKHDQDGTTGL